MSKCFCSDSQLHERLSKGINILADNVAATLGPRGRNVILQKKDATPIVTKDGVTIALFTDLEDPIENAGVQIIKQASVQTNNDAGDGTTTATVLARAILNQSQKYLVAGVPPIELKKGMDEAVKVIVENLEEMAKPISSEEDITHIASISANGDQTIGKLIATAVDKIGKDGSITVEEARSVDTSLEFVEGFRIDSGYLSPQFVTDARRDIVKYEDCYILIADESIESVEQILPVLEVVARENQPLLIIAENVEGQALAALIMNTIRGTMRVAAIKAPRYGEERRSILKDLAVSIGAKLISRSSTLKLKDVKLEHLGKVKIVEATKYDTILVGGKGDPDEVEKRIESVKIVLDKTDSLHECERLQERITRLASGVAIIKVGGLTEIEMIEKKHRVEDALEAVRSAQLEGIVPGGGVALIRASEGAKVKTDNENQKLGAKIIFEAIKEPLKQMALNAGESPDIVLNKVENNTDNFGVDFASTSLEVVDMYEHGIIDPVKVVRCALKNAVSVASTLITTDYAICEL